MVELKDLQVGLFLWHSYSGPDDEEVHYPVEITGILETGFIYTSLEDFRTGLVVDFNVTSFFFNRDNFTSCAKEEALVFLERKLKSKQEKIKKVESNLQALRQSEDKIRLFVNSH